MDIPQVHRRLDTSDAEVLALTRVGLFQTLSESDLQRLTRAGRCRTYSVKEMIAGEDAYSSTLHVITSGIARLLRYSENGCEVTLNLLREGEVCGLQLLVGPTAGQTNMLQALTDHTTVWSIPAATAKPLAASYPQVPSEVAQVLGRQLEEAHDWMVAAHSQSVRSRLESTLRTIVEWNGNNTVPFDYGVLASILGASRETTARELGNLRAERLITFQPHHRDTRILVPDPTRLRENR